MRRAPFSYSPAKPAPPASQARRVSTCASPSTTMTYGTPRSRVAKPQPATHPSTTSRALCCARPRQHRKRRREYDAHAADDFELRGPRHRAVVCCGVGRPCPAPQKGKALARVCSASAALLRLVELFVQLAAVPQFRCYCCNTICPAIFSAPPRAWRIASSFVRLTDGAEAAASSSAVAASGPAAGSDAREEDVLQLVLSEHTQSCTLLLGCLRQAGFASLHAPEDSPRHSPACGRRRWLLRSPDDRSGSPSTPSAGGGSRSGAGASAPTFPLATTGAARGGPHSCRRMLVVDCCGAAAPLAVWDPPAPATWPILALDPSVRVGAQPRRRRRRAGSPRSACSGSAWRRSAPLRRRPRRAAA